MEDLRPLKEKMARVWPHLDERARRLLAASEARQIGHGGVSLVSRACGLSRVTITKALKELDEPPLAGGRVRRPGGGRPLIEIADPELPGRLDELVEPSSRGDPESPLRWTSKSTRALSTELTASGHPISHETVAQVLRHQGYSLQATRKTQEGEQHPDRDAQFRFINEEVRKALAAKRPVISVDTKKKELVGNYENAGRQWRRAKAPHQVKVHDFPTPDVPRAYPYGLYDLAHNTGFVNIGTDHDTGAFAVASIRGWWRAEGRRLYPRARRLLITADGGGSNGYRLRLWKVKLQEFADEAAITIRVCHFPPGTSKWNKVEHRLFSFISTNWRGEPLRDYETIVRLIARTTTAQGLKVRCRLDRQRYPVGYTDGRTERILNVPRYDPHWQLTYYFAEPLDLPPGTRIIAVGIFDNSAGNPHNPDPTKEVRWGLQSWEEMHTGFFRSCVPGRHATRRAFPAQDSWAVGCARILSHSRTARDTLRARP